MYEGIEKKKPRNLDAQNKFYEDINRIESLNERYDLNNTGSNKELYKRLKSEKSFQSWIGLSFMYGLQNKTVSNHKRKVATTVFRLISICAVILAFVLVVVLLLGTIEDSKQEAVLEYVREEKYVYSLNRLNGTDASDGSESSQTGDILPEYATLYSMYPDMVGWIKINDTNIDYPVMQKADNDEYYLTHDYTGQDNSCGALFLSADSCVTPMDDCLVIFGHDTNNDSIFGELKNYKDSSYYDEHQYINFDTLYERKSYEIISVIQTKVLYTDESGFRYYWFHNFDESFTYNDFLQWMSENELYDTGKTYVEGQHLILLSTCDESAENGRLVVVAAELG